MAIERLNIYSWNISGGFRLDSNAYTQGHFGNFGNIFGCWRDKYWHEWVGWRGGTAFKSPKVFHWCVRKQLKVVKKLWTFSGAVKHSQVLTGVAYWEVLWNDHSELVMDMFGPKWARYRPTVGMGASAPETYFGPSHKPNNTTKFGLGLSFIISKTDQGVPQFIRGSQ